MSIIYKLSKIKILIFHKLLVGIIFVLFLNGLISYSAIHNIIKLNKLYEIQVENSKVERSLQNLKLAFSQILMPANDYLIHGDKIEETHFEDFYSDIYEKIRSIKKETSNNTRQLFLKDIENRLEKINFLSKEIFKAEEPLSNKETHIMMENMDNIASITIDDINKLIMIEIQELDEQFVYNNDVVDRTILFISITNVFSVIILFIGGYFYVKNITKPIKQLTELTKEIKSGNLSFKSDIKPRNNDEIEVLSNLFQDMVGELSNSTVSKAYLNNILKRIADSVVITDIYGVIKIVNKATLNLLGYSEEELVGQSISTIFKTKSQSEIKYFQRKYNIESEKESNTSNKYITKSGEQVTVTFFKAKIFDKKNNIKGILYIASHRSLENIEDFNISKKNIIYAKKLKTNIDVPLTVRELEIIKLITEDYSNLEISEKLFISIRTVETHRRNIMQKLHTSSVISLVHYAYQNKII